MKLEVRPAETVEDYEALVSLEHASFNPSDCFTLETWKGYRAFFVLADTKVAAGVFAFGENLSFSGDWAADKESVGSIYLTNIFVVPGMEGRGVASFAMQWLIAWARANHFERISSNCRASNAASLRLHEKFGFKIIGQTPGFYEDPVEAAIELELVL